MIDHNTNVALTNDIKAHILENGPNRWNEIRRRYPEVSDATFWRRVRASKAAVRAHGDRDPARPRAVVSRGSGPLAESLAGACAKAVCGGFTAAMLMEQRRKILEDADLLRAASLDAAGKIAKPATFLQSINLRTKFVENTLSRLEQMYDHKSVEALYRSIFDIIIETVPSPYVQVVVEALTQLSRRIAERSL